MDQTLLDLLLEIFLIVGTVGVLFLIADNIWRYLNKYDQIMDVPTLVNLMFQTYTIDEIKDIMSRLDTEMTKIQRNAAEQSAPLSMLKVKKYGNGRDGELTPEDIE